MIPAAAVTAWSVMAPWPTRTQVEQDLLLSRLICEIANHPYLGEELIFRGGTCFHKLHINPARRYSEDLDYVRTSAGGIKELTGAMTALGAELGFRVSTKVSANPKVNLLTESVENLPIRIKVEVNTHERRPADPIALTPFEVASPWWSGRADVRTFSTRELVATKIRAIYQRKKGRDVFDCGWRSPNWASPVTISSPFSIPTAPRDSRRRWPLPTCGPSCTTKAFAATWNRS